MAYRKPNPVTHFEVSGESNAMPASNNGVTLVAGSGISLSTGAGSVTIAASGGSSSDTYVIDHFGNWKWVQDQIHGHQAYAYNQRYHYISISLGAYATIGDPDDDTFTATIVNSALYIRSGIIPAASTLEGWAVDGYFTETLSAGNAKWSIWHAPAPTDAVDYDTTVTWTRVSSITWSGTGTDDTYYKGSASVSSGNSWAAGDWWALTVQPSSTDVYMSSSNNNFNMASYWAKT